MVTGRAWLVWTWPLRPVPVAACPLCAALVSAEDGGTAAHERWHRSLTADDDADRKDS